MYQEPMGKSRRKQFGAHRSSFRAGLDASWEVDVFGARGHALEASEADARASAAQLGQARVTLAAEVALFSIAM